MLASPAGRGVIIPMLFTTDGTGNATPANGVLGYSASRSTDTYTITLPSWGTTLAVHVTAGDDVTVASWTATPASGTLVIEFSAAVTSNQISVMLMVDQGQA